MGRVFLAIGLAILGLFLLSSLDSSDGVGSIFPNRERTERAEKSLENIRQGEIIPPGSLNEAISDEIEGAKADIRDLKSELEKIENSANSKYKGKITISSSSGAKQSSPDKERIELKVSSNVEEKIKITGWRLESAVSGVGDNIDGGTYLPYSAQINNELDIFVGAGDKIIITTGRSPLGTSFRLNLCTGYFEQFQDFDPSIRKTCPKPIDELPNLGPGLEFEACYEFVRKLPRCEMYLKELPLKTGGACLNFITEDLNYNNCVSDHKEDENFYSNEWRIFLGRSSELWKNKRELIKLIDNEGKVVDAVTY
jgi:hypothetical protein